MEARQRAQSALWRLFRGNKGHYGGSSEGTEGTVEALQREQRALWRLFRGPRGHFGGSSEGIEGTVEALQRTLLALQETGQELSRGNLQLRD